MFFDDDHYSDRFGQIRMDRIPRERKRQENDEVWIDLSMCNNAGKALSMIRSVGRSSRPIQYKYIYI